MVNEIFRKIYYHDTDSGRVVYYANYLKYFEEGRTEYLRDRGIDIKELSEKGIVFVVQHVDIAYKAPARYGDNIKICTSIGETRKASFGFLQEAKLDDKILVSAKTQLVCVDSKTFKPKRIPDEINSGDRTLN